MRRKLRPHLTYANVMATIAVFLAMGGGVAWALSNNSVKSKHIKDGHVRSADVANDGSGFELQGDDIDEASLDGVPRVIEEVTIPDFDFGGLATGRCVTVSSGLTDPQPGDFVLATVTGGDSLPPGFIFVGENVAAVGTVTATLCNHSGTNLATGPTIDIRLAAVRF